MKIHSLPAMPAVCQVPVAIYTRVSTTSQVGGRFDSCESQAAVCRDYLAKHADEGWHEIACYTDAAYSGGNMNRPGILALKRQIETGLVKVVLIFKLERVLRSTDEWAPFRTFLHKHGCRLVSTTEDLSEETPSGRLKNNLLVSVAEYERLNTAEKVRSKMLEQAKRGYWNYGLVPLGYSYDAKKQLLEVEPSEGPLVRRIFEEVARLVPPTDIANQLSDEGHRTRTRVWLSRDGAPRTVGGTRFRSDTIRDVVRNPLYAGRVRFHGKDYPAKHAPVVTGELWEMANAALAKPRVIRRDLLRTSDKPGHLLTGLVYCEHCRRALVPYATTQRGAGKKQYRYYVCGYFQKERDANGCPVRHVPATVLESSVVTIIGKIVDQPALLHEAIEGSRLRDKRDRQPLRKQLAEIDQALAATNKQINNCVTAIAMGGAEALAGEIRTHALELKEKKQELLVNHEQVRQDLAACEQDLVADDRIRVALGRFAAIFPKLTALEQKQLVQLCIDRINVCAKTLSRQRVSEGDREIQLQIKLPIARLVEGLEEQLVVEKRGMRKAPMERRALTLELSLGIDARGGAWILQPFVHELIASRPAKRVATPVVSRHAIHRARAWAQLRAKTPGLTLNDLAEQVGYSLASVGFHLGLLKLAPEIQGFLMRLSDRAAIQHFGMMRMLVIAKSDIAGQRAKFSALRAAFRPM